MKLYIHLELIAVLLQKKSKVEKGIIRFGLTSQETFSVTVMLERHTHNNKHKEKKTVHDCHLSKKKKKEILHESTQRGDSR